jgi:HEAT repeat protein
MKNHEVSPRRPRGLRLAFLLGAAAIAAVGVAAYLLRERVLEEWHLVQLASGDAETREAAAERLVELGSPRGILEFLERRGGEENVRWRDRAEAAVRRLSPAQAGRLAREALRGEQTVLWDLLELLDEAKSAGAAAAAFHCVLLQDHDAAVRRVAAELLGRAGAAAAVAIPPLAAALDDPDRDVRFWATTALAKIDPDGTGGALALHRAMLSGDAGLQAFAAYARGKAE